MPSSTSQSTTLPSVMDRPHLGMPSFWISALIARGGRRARDLADGVRDLVGRRNVGVLQDRAERHRRVRRRDHPRRRLQVRESLLRDTRDDVAGHAAPGAGLVDDDEAPGVLDALEDRVLVQRRGRAGIDDLAARCRPRRQLLGGLLGEVHHAPERDDRHVGALADDVGLPNGIA